MAILGFSFAYQLEYSSNKQNKEFNKKIEEKLDRIIEQSYDFDSRKKEQKEKLFDVAITINLLNDFQHKDISYSYTKNKYIVKVFHNGRWYQHEDPELELAISHVYLQIHGIL
ncbi:hypothetical protein [Calidifontibacillus erzurumensis]|uniref:hypothetical protein n=1 Tax=Calidifontibacillus erzurumensis TaxID=2741433 RepID=UPI0035B54BE5